MPNSLHIACPQCNGINRVPDDRLEQQPKCGKCRAPLFEAHPVVLNAANFQAHIHRSDIQVLIDFWAAWCGPCQMMAPIFTEAARTLEPRVRLAKVDTEAEQGLAAQFGIRSIPTLVLMKNGQEINRVAGAMQLNDLVQWVRQSI
jgi:thioredoxin 2